MAYTAQFDLLSPCYKKGEQPAGFHMGGVKVKPAKKGKKATTVKKSSTKKGKSSKQRGGSSCGASMSVAEMGVVDKPASLEPTKSELAWDNRMKGGATEIDIVNNTVLNPKPNNNKTKALNEIKNKLIPSETISGYVLVVTKLSKNKNNTRKDKYSIQIISKEENGTTQIEKLDKTEFDFRDISDNVYKISKKVFPPPEKKPNENNKSKTGTANATANEKAKANEKANAKVNAKANANSQTQAKANNSSSLLANNSNPTGARNNFP